MYAQTALKPNSLLRNGAYGIVMRGVQKCTRGCSSLRGKKALPLCCIIYRTATDPPYNTGNEGWVYNDNVNGPQIRKWFGEVVCKEGKDLSRHDKWLCMMYPRLRLLQKLLPDDGGIFVSIDDLEVSYLRIVMDEIFGKNKFIA